MASATPPSFRHILLIRLLILLMPLLGISEWLILHQTRLSLLANAQQRANEIAKSHAVTLELRQQELLGRPTAVSQCISPSNNAPIAAAAQLSSCAPQSIIERSLDNLLSQPFQSPAHGPAIPVLAILGPQGELLGHSSPSPAQSQTSTFTQPEKVSTDELIQQLSSSNFQTSQPFSENLAPLAPQLILNDQWIVSSHSVRLAPFATAVSDTMPPEQAQGQVIVAIPTRGILMPLKRLSYWMFGAAIGFIGISIAVALYLSRALARPAEQLRDRLLAVQQQLTAAELNPPGNLTSPSLDELPLHDRTNNTFKIHEFQQLAGAFNQLIHGLNQRSTALEKATQEAHTASQLKSDFLAATSHELRTPLNALIGHIQLIQDGYCDNSEEEAACLKQVNQAALHLLKVLNELLDIARIEAGQFEFEHQSFELAQLLEEVIEMERSQIITKGLTLQQRSPSAPSSAPPSYWVQADRDKLKQVILNVLSNAIKFTDQGNINIALYPLCKRESLAPPPPEATIVLSITDTGIGIDQRQRKKLFRPFARASQPGQQPYEGSGLGLTISRTLMERMGGSIHLHSPGLGQGTTVELHLPLYPSPSSTQQQSSQEATAPEC